MMNETNGTNDGRGGLRDRVPPIELPAELEQRVRGTLTSRGLVGSLGAIERSTAAAPSRSAWLVRIGLLAAGVVIGALVRGSVAGGSGRPTGAAAAGQYVLLLYGDPADDTGAVHIAREREYGRWASTLRDGAKWVGGHELSDVIERLGPASSATEPTADRLAGYFVIEAPSRERAAQVARSCPHLKYGGRVVVMSIAG